MKATRCRALNGDSTRCAEDVLEGKEHCLEHHLQILLETGTHHRTGKGIRGQIRKLLTRKDFITIITGATAGVAAVGTERLLKSNTTPDSIEKVISLKKELSELREKQYQLEQFNKALEAQQHGQPYFWHMPDFRFEAVDFWRRFFSTNPKGLLALLEQVVLQPEKVPNVSKLLGSLALLGTAGCLPDSKIASSACAILHKAECISRYGNSFKATSTAEHAAQRMYWEARAQAEGGKRLNERCIEVISLNFDDGKVVSESELELRQWYYNDSSLDAPIRSVVRKLTSEKERDKNMRDVHSHVFQHLPKELHVEVERQLALQG